MSFGIKESTSMNQARWPNSSILTLLAVLLVFILPWLLCPQEFIASDPWNYSHRAFSISQSGDFGEGASRNFLREMKKTEPEPGACAEKPRRSG
jgi:hypothetical protein